MSAERYIEDLEKLAAEAAKSNSLVLIHPEAVRLLTNALRHANEVLLWRKIGSSGSAALENLKEAFHDIAIAQAEAERLNRTITP